MRKTFSILALLVSALIATSLLSTVAADSVYAGFDAFETVASQTRFSYEQPCTAIPAEFFGPGSDPFMGVVQFDGVPLGSFMGFRTGDADTIVKRDNVAPLASIPSSDTIPIELVALSLVGAQPIIVTYGGGGSPELWDIGAVQSPSRPSTGTMTIRHTDTNGGTFDSVLTVFPMFTFTRVSDGAQRILDAGAIPDYPQPCIDGITLRAANVPWLHVGCTRSLNANFCASSRPGEKVMTVEQALYAQHGILPANPPDHIVVGGVPLPIAPFALLLPYVVIGSAILAGTIATTVFVRHSKKQ